MKKDEIIELLKEQLRVANDTVGSLTTQVNELIERIKSLEELLVQKGIAIDKANRQNKALGKLVSGKKSERQEKNPQASMEELRDYEEFKIFIPGFIGTHVSPNVGSGNLSGY